MNTQMLPALRALHTHYLPRARQGDTVRYLHFTEGQQRLEDGKRLPNKHR